MEVFNLAENKENKNKNDDDEFYEEIAEAADFVNDRLDNFVAPTALNNTVEEYAQGEKGKD
jgi:uncharacterized UPF0160 family protein